MCIFTWSFSYWNNDYSGAVTRMESGRSLLMAVFSTQTAQLGAVYYAGICQIHLFILQIYILKALQLLPVQT